MVRSFTLAASFVCASAIVWAQAPAEQQPAPQKPAAQQPSAQQPPATKPAEQSKLDVPVGTVTYVGCLKQGPTATTWLLEHAEPGGTAPRAGAAVGTAGSKPGTMQTFSLTARPTDNLKPHLNHKIEVTGIMAPAAGTAGTPAAQSAAADPSGAKKADARDALTVQSFKMVSATCP